MSLFPKKKKYHLDKMLRSGRNQRYYLKHRDEIKEKRRERYRLTGR